MTSIKYAYWFKMIAHILLSGSDLVHLRAKWITKAVEAGTISTLTVLGIENTKYHITLAFTCIWDLCHLLKGYIRLKLLNFCWVHSILEGFQLFCACCSGKTTEPCRTQNIHIGQGHYVGQPLNGWGCPLNGAAGFNFLRKFG